MTVHFIGAGPGAADLLTLRGRNLIAGCPVCLYAGSLIPEEILSHCPTGARIINTAPLDLDAIIAECKAIFFSSSECLVHLDQCRPGLAPAARAASSSVEL